MTKLPTDTGIISITRKKAIELIQDEMKEEIKKFKKNINEYYNPNIQNKPNLLKDTINDYITKILPYMKKIQELFIATYYYQQLLYVVKLKCDGKSVHKECISKNVIVLLFD